MFSVGQCVDLYQKPDNLAYFLILSPCLTNPDSRNVLKRNSNQ